ncbi:MAG: glycoside hydrolase family 172 protein [Candidatus Dormibacteria bacterium]
MNLGPEFGRGLGNLPLITGARTRSISPENPTGEKGRGGMAIPDPGNPALPFSGAARDLGQGWKVNPFIKPKARETVVIADISGPGVIQHIWIGTEPRYARSCVLRFYWDGETTPSIEVPLGDFFAIGHGVVAPVNSMPVVSNRAFGLNCYWPMPFREQARITFTNDGNDDMTLLAYQVTYAETEVPEAAGYLHAQWRRSVTEREKPEHILLDDVRGAGQYVGTFLSWTQLSSGWFGEGEVKFFIDGDDAFPTICGTGTEDYFGVAYGFPETFSAPFVGCTLRYDEKLWEQVRPRPQDAMAEAFKTLQGPPRWSLYRWHIMDPVCFAEDLKVSIQALGWYSDHTFQPLADDIASVALWYQSEPHAPFPEFPGLKQRLPR